MKLKSILLTAAATISLATATMAQVPSYVPTNGLIGYWPLNSNAIDASGNGNNGAVNGATLTTDRNGNANSAYNFNGTNSRIDINDNAALRLSNTDFTISFWVKINSYNTNGATAFIYKRAAGSQNGWGLYAEMGYYNRLGFIVSENSDPRAYLDSTLSINTWHNVVITYTLSTHTARFYVGGLLLNITTGVDSNFNPVSALPSPSGTCNSIMRIGNDSNNNSYFFNGALDDIGIWNRALTQQELSALFYSNCFTSLVTLTPSGTNNVCLGDIVNLTTITGSGYTYVWKNNNVIIPGATASNYTATTLGSYTVTVKDANNCSSTSIATVINFNAFPSSVISNSNTIIPNGGSVTLNANFNNNYNYKWLKNGVLIIGANSSSFIANSTGNYSVVETVGSCVDTSNVVSVTLANSDGCLPSYLPYNGLIGWWSFCGDANDASGNGNNGIVDGASLTYDRFGDPNNAFDFNGVNNFITIPGSLPAATSFTYSYYLKLIDYSLPTTTDGWQYAYRVAYNRGGYRGYNFSAVGDSASTNPEYSFTVRGGGFCACGSSAGGTYTLPLNNWVHVVNTFSSNGLHIFINGFLTDSASFVVDLNDLGNYPLYIGAMYYDGVNFFKGALDDFGYWNRALTAEEILSLYLNSSNGVITAIDPPNNLNSLNVYPNPASKHLTIDYGNFNVMNGCRLSIVNSIGQTIFTSLINQRTSYIDLSNLTGSGIYYLQLIDTQNNTIENKKIVIE
jgi:hypothetical protein